MSLLSAIPPAVLVTANRNDSLKSNPRHCLSDRGLAAGQQSGCRGACRLADGVGGRDSIAGPLDAAVAAAGSAARRQHGEPRPSKFSAPGGAWRRARCARDARCPARPHRARSVLLRTCTNAGAPRSVCGAAPRTERIGLASYPDLRSCRLCLSSCCRRRPDGTVRSTW